MSNVALRISVLGCALLCAASGLAAPPASPPVTEFAGGRWFAESGFEPGSFFSVDGLLTRKRPGRVDRTVDLAGRYVIPPFGEGHNHNIDSPPRPGQLERYVEAGVLYVMIQNDLPLGPPAEASEGAVDVAYAHGGLTSSSGHVVELFTKLADRGVLGSLARDDLDGRAFFTIDEAADLDRKWPSVLAGKPDFVKAYLGFSDEPPEGGGTPRPGHPGLDPRLVSPIVERAHAAGLRVSAHIETAADFRLAVESGIDIIAHLPGWRLDNGSGGSADLDRFRIAKEDARRAAERGVIVITTVLAGGAVADPENVHHAQTRELHRSNLDLLRKSGVRLAIGSDHYSGTSVEEALLLGKQALVRGVEPLAVFDNASLLRLWCEQTPRMIFPGRKIGRLEEGYEASFLVLEGDPIADFGNVRRIVRRVKNGRVIPREAR